MSPIAHEGAGGWYDIETWAIGFELSCATRAADHTAYITEIIKSLLN